MLGNEKCFAKTSFSTPGHWLAGIASPLRSLSAIILSYLGLTMRQNCLGLVLSIEGNVLLRKLSLASFRAGGKSDVKWREKVMKANGAKKIELL